MAATNTLLRTDKDIETIYQRHVDKLYRVANSFMKNGADEAAYYARKTLSKVKRKVGFTTLK